MFSLILKKVRYWFDKFKINISFTVIFLDDMHVYIYCQMAIKMKGIHFFQASNLLPTNSALIWQKEASDKSDISRKRAKCVCHLHWRQWNIMMSYLTYLLVGWVFLHEIWPGRRAHYVNYENINNSNLDGMSLASFCQSRAELTKGFTTCTSGAAPGCMLREGKNAGGRGRGGVRHILFPTSKNCPPKLW